MSFVKKKKIIMENGKENFIYIYIKYLMLYDGTKRKLSARNHLFACENDKLIGNIPSRRR